MHHFDEPVYMISIVAKILDIHPQTLRQYERENLIAPSRSDGRIRLYSQRDIEKIKMILRLTREVGVNLAGVDVVMRLKEKMEAMEQEMIELRAEISRMRNSSGVPPEKSLVTKRSIYEMVIFDDDILK
ncbi:MULTISPECIES: helix-turn-helix transcriptional regulator [unclassified Sulfuricurvum]|uniref:heat shock protein transcriptional repressor HspR n=1 Tax=unclassified Sulfuricurvum TaxID=2632390 RepID=UPI0002999C5F|nr:MULTISPECIES: helix-turn-helix transcriptional regulator [unclassified Sulfuricurvum]OHD84217.1 MAG: MerR family transcriptional regulator [Sulfuricurvum sp. RIFCSPLOWO2_02_43_6]OHD84635.1 MAG: MerR family transcriptional regulator [Sulfuricurvum sp. RIFCSPHIGHO2_02_FULL_43_9]OHD85584.1 MAG: MerR family transcriptional regulator [Sulfuricurvum sp. RIFCSPLOWO2_02_FULL_43_45]OHD90013.1 MAG: MerR family transcriptional regulator [Sulfuricurvum sp. RIFCSPHIGHO2_12_FULL_44_8]AFV98095.1 MerR fami